MKPVYMKPCINQDCLTLYSETCLYQTMYKSGIYLVWIHVHGSWSQMVFMDKMVQMLFIDKMVPMFLVNIMVPMSFMDKMVPVLFMDKMVPMSFMDKMVSLVH